MDAPFPSILPELLDIILDNIDSRQDLLSLALCCSSLASAIIPERMDHHTIVTSPYHIPLWEHLSTHRKLASYVRSLTLYDDPRQANPQKDRWRSPSSLGDLPHDYTAGKYDTDHLIHGLRNMANVSRLRFRYVRTAHLRAAMPTLPNTLSIVFSNLTTLEHVCTTTRLSPSDEEALHDCNHPMWKLSGLKSLNLDLPGEEETLWPAFQSVLVKSPSLQELRLPDFLTEETMAKLCDLRFPYLRRFDRAFSWSMALTPRIVQFLYAHPNVETLHWPTIATTGIPSDCLPSLRHLSAPNASFLFRFLEGQAPQSVHLESFDDVPMTQELLTYMDALDPLSLRHLHIESIDDYSSLRSIASRFHSIVELHLPRRGAWKENSRFATRLARAMLRPWVRELQLLPLAEVVTLFPRLEVVHGARCPSGLDPKWSTDDPRTRVGLEKLRLLYPGLRRVNDWRLRP